MVSLLKPLGFRSSATLSFLLNQLFLSVITVWVNRGGKWLRKVNWLVLLSSVAPWFSVVYWGEPVGESGAALLLTRSQICSTDLEAGCLRAACVCDGWPADPFLSRSFSDWGNEAVAMQKQVTADRHWLPHQRNWSPTNKRYDSGFQLMYTCCVIIIMLAVSHWVREVSLDRGLCSCSHPFCTRTQGAAIVLLTTSPSWIASCCWLVTQDLLAPWQHSTADRNQATNQLLHTGGGRLTFMTMPVTY